MNHAEIIKKLEKLENRIIRMEPYMAAPGETHSGIVKRVIALEEKAATAAGEVSSDILERIVTLESQVKKAYVVFEIIDETMRKLNKNEEFLEHKIDKIGKLCALQNERIKYLEKEHDVERLDRDSMRLNQVYYHVFPERLSQDIKLKDQLNALNSKPAPDAGSKEA